MVQLPGTRATKLEKGRGGLLLFISFIMDGGFAPLAKALVLFLLMRKMVC
jgi:hypothetical protein